MEALQLLSSTVYQEKQIGYMALGILLHENHELIPLIVNSCKVDLDSNNAMFQALALSAIANIGGKEMADSLSPVVIKILTAPTTKAYVLKRAALCLLRLYRKFPDVVEHDTIAPVVSKLIKSDDMGVQLSATGLLIGLAAKEPEFYQSMRTVCAAALHRIVVQKQYKKQYLFYGLPAPWLQIKLLRFQRYFASPGADAAAQLDGALKAIFEAADQEAPASKGVNYRNARHAVLQEAAALVIQQRRRPELVRQSVALMGRFVSAKATNVRYLALDSMAHLANMGTEALALRRHVDTVIGMLSDKDISIRRRALDVLYCMCDDKLAKKIVSELLRYLIVADYEIREELVVKIAILAEKFATVYSWYVDVILQLISIAGDYVADDIWFRVVQIVTNHEDIQEYAAAMAFEALHHASCHEATVKVGGYLLGEFGHLIADDEGCSPHAQFAILSAKYPLVSLETRALLLSTYVKLANLYSELTEPVRAALQRCSADLDVESQKRAVEYAALLARGDDELLASVLDVMPAFPDRGSLVLEAAERKRAKAAGPVAADDDNDDDDDDEAFEPVGFVNDAEIDAFEGNADDNDDDDDEGSSEEPEEVRIAREEAARAAEKAAKKAASKAKKSKKKKGSSTTSTPAAAAAAPVEDLLSGGARPSGALADLFGLDLSAPASAPPPGSNTLADLGMAAAATPSSALGDLFGGSSVAAPAAAPASAGPLRDGGAIDVALRLLTAKNDGVLYEDGTLQIGVKSTFDNGSGTLTLFYGNKQASALPFVCALLPSDDIGVAQTASVPASLPPQSQTQQALSGITARRAFAESARLALRVGSDNFTLRLPLAPTKFCAPVTLPAATFFAQWAKLDGVGAHQAVLQAAKPVSPSFCALLLQAARLAALTEVDPNANNAVGCGKFVLAGAAPLGVLVRIEPSAQAQAYRLSVRTPDALLTRGIAAMLSAHLTAP